MSCPETAKLNQRVIVNGTFDILHPGHVELLNFARSCGDFLLVAIDTDERVSQLKPGRPINNQWDRRFILRNLKSVDKVVFFNSDEELLSLVKECDIMVKGSDYRGQPIIGSDCIEIKFYERTEHSTTKIIQRITDR